MGRWGGGEFIWEGGESVEIAFALKVVFPLKIEFTLIYFKK